MKQRQTNDGKFFLFHLKQRHCCRSLILSFVSQNLMNNINSYRLTEAVEEILLAMQSRTGEG